MNNILKEFNNLKILVVGDVMLDHYVTGSVTRISPEAPVPVLLKKDDSYFLGGAGNVLGNIISLGGKADLMSVVGKDETGFQISKLVEKIGSDPKNILFSKDRISTKKTRFIGNNFQLLRVDSEIEKDITDKEIDWFSENFNQNIGRYDSIIIQDYNKGLLTPQLIQNLIKIAKQHGKKILVDPKKGNIKSYKSSFLLKPNFSEFCSMTDTNHHVTDFKKIFETASTFIKEMDLDCLVITLSENGILYCNKDFYLHSPTSPLTIRDVSGAGDSVSAILSLSLNTSATLQQTLLLSNLAGSIACSKMGTVFVSYRDILEHLPKSDLPEINY